MPDTYTYTQVRRVTPQGGTIAGGTPVTVSGFGFDFATGSVTFGGSAATSIVIVSNTTITCVTPEHASGAVDVVVAGVGTGSGIYTYQNPATTLLPRVPVTTDPKDGYKLDIYGAPKWLMVVKQRLEQTPIIDSGSVFGGSALTAVSDLNVTATLSGTPATALLKPVTLTLGWTGALTPSRGGTGLQAYTTGDLLYASSALVLSRLADVSAGSYLRSGGVATAPLWSTLKLPNAVTAGSVVFASATNTYGQDNANLFWDDSNNVFGVGTAAPVTTFRMTIDSATGTGNVIRFRNSAATRYRSDFQVTSSGIQLNSADDGAAVRQPIIFDGSQITLQTSLVRIGSGTPTAQLHISAGSTAASTAPIKLTSGALMTTAEVGAIEFLTDTFYATITTGAARKGVILDDGARLTSGQIPIATTNGRLIDNGAPAALTKTDDTNVTLTLGGTPATALLKATSLTLGWTGTLSVARGGTGTGTAFTQGSVIFAGASGTYAQDNANFFWDATNHRLGIGTTGPTHTVDVGGQLNVGFSGTSGSFTLTSSATNNQRIRDDTNADFGRTRIFNSADVVIVQLGGNVVNFITAAAFGLSVTSPTAILHLKAGTTAASTAPLKFNSGSLMTTAEAGAVEFLTDDFYATITTGAARKGIVLNDGTALTSGRVPFATTNGRLTDDADLTFATDTLSATKVAMSSLTSGRVPFASTAGLLVDDSDMTFATDTLTVTKLSAPTSVSTGTLAQTGKTTTYNNIATSGWGVVAIQKDGRSTAQTAAVASVAAYTVGAADGSFVIDANVNVTTSTTHNFTVAVDYTDETNTAQTLTLTFSSLAGVFLTAITNVTGAGPYEGVSLHIRCKASTAITVKTVGSFTTVVYNVEANIRQVA